MCTSNKDDRAKDVERLIRATELGRRYSWPDRCWVTNIPCSLCGSFYDEEFEAAQAKAVSGVAWVCLLCDIKSLDEPPRGSIVQAMLGSYWRTTITGE